MHRLRRMPPMQHFFRRIDDSLSIRIGFYDLYRVCGREGTAYCMPRASGELSIASSGDSDYLQSRVRWRIMSRTEMTPTGLPSSTTGR